MMHLGKSLAQSTPDIRVLWVSVFIRMLAFGLCNQVLTLYLASLGISEPLIGVFMTLTMVGDTVLSYLLTWNANKLGNRRIMVAGAAVMFLSGLVFASDTQSFVVLLTAAIFGVISPSGTDTGPFRSIEEGVIARLTPLNHRPEVFAIHGLLSSVGAALGSIVSGFAVDTLLSRGYTDREAYQAMFLGYGLIALAKVFLLLLLSQKCEPDYAPIYGEEDPLIEEDEDENFPTVTGMAPAYQTQLFRLLLCFMLDSFGWGFMPSAWVVYYFKLVFQISATVLGSVFFVTSIVSAVAGIPSAYLGKRLGPIRSSLFTQIPCGVFNIGIPLCGSHFFPASLFLTFQQLLSAMDVVPRQILVTSVFPNKDVVRSLGLIAIGKTAARAVGPIFTGKLASMGLLWVNFLISGGCLIVSNVILWLFFPALDTEILRKQKTDLGFE